MLKRLLITTLIMTCILQSAVVCSPNVLASSEAEQKVGYDTGLTLGTEKGKEAGAYDKKRSYKEDWETRYTEAYTKAVNEYKLTNESQAYQIYFREGFQIGFSSGYRTGYNDIIIDSLLAPKELGEKHGEYFGKLLGEVHGRKDSQSGLKSDWGRTFPTTDSTISKYQLQNDTKEYRDAFILSYQKGYKEHYEYQYSKFQFDNHRIYKEHGVINGTESGTLAGTFMATKYRLENIKNDWQEAKTLYINMYPLDRTYSLLHESSEYREGFLQGFTEGFKVAFVTTYQDMSIKSSKENINFKTVSVFEDTIEYKATLIDYILGERRIREQTLASLHIAPGTMYRQSLIGLTKHEGSTLMKSQTYQQATDIFDVRIVNAENRVLLNKPLRLSFPFFEHERAGVYQFVDSTWKYQHSQFDHEKQELYIEIPAGVYSGGSYAVFVDDQYQDIQDIAMHWAKDELYTYLRRHYIQADAAHKFYPQEKMTRGDMLLLTSKVFTWPTTTDTTSIKSLKDYEQLGKYANVAQYAFAQRLITPKHDSTSGIREYVSYQEVEGFMKGLLQREFSWQTIAESMMQEKYTRSQSTTGNNAHVTRAEMVYMLHQLEEEYQTVTK